MSYTPTVWTVNDVVTAERLNKIENAIQHHDPCVEQFVVLYDEINDFQYINTTYNHILESLNAHKHIAIIDYRDPESNQAPQIGFVVSCIDASVTGTNYRVIIRFTSIPDVYEAATANEMLAWI